MKIIYEPVQNLGYLFIPQHVFGLTANLFKQMVNFELLPVSDLLNIEPINKPPKVKIYY